MKIQVAVFCVVTPYSDGDY